MVREKDDFFRGIQRESKEFSWRLMIKLYHSAGTIIKNELHNRKDCFIA